MKLVQAIVGELARYYELGLSVEQAAGLLKSSGWHVSRLSEHDARSFDWTLHTFADHPPSRHLRAGFVAYGRRALERTGRAKKPTPARVDTTPRMTRAELAWEKRAMLAEVGRRRDRRRRQRSR